MKCSEKQDQSNDVKALLNRLQGPLIRYAFQITGDLERARDVVQDTFLQLCSEDRTSLNGHLEPWLFTVCRNRAAPSEASSSPSEHRNPAGPRPSH